MFRALVVEILSINIQYSFYIQLTIMMVFLGQDSSNASGLIYLKSLIL